MEKIETILKCKIKPKEKILLLADTLKKNKKMLDELFVYFEKAKDADKGNLLSSITEIVKEEPEFIGNYLDTVINCMNHKAPRVKWESSEIIAHASKAFPQEVEPAIKNLIENTCDEGPVVKWSAAFALTEIGKNNKETRKKLVPLFKEKARNESNNGVKKIYLKALKFIEKEK
jgi:HEAT repeat protein